MHADLLGALGTDDGDLIVAAPAPRPDYWAGGPSALIHQGRWWLAYRLRRPVDEGRGYANVVARSDDGIRFETVATITAEAMGAASLERPALVVRPDGGWRLYVSCSTPNSKHWWVEALDADSPAGLGTGSRSMVLPGSAAEAWKDVVVRADADSWRMWACRHPLDGGDDQADRMTTVYATSADGLHWDLGGTALGPGEGWDRRGARVTAVEPTGDGRWWALYDGRASAAENWRERTGLALGPADQLTPVAGPTSGRGGVLRYASVVPVSAGWRVFFESASASGAHDLRAVNVPRPVADSQSV